MKATKLASGFAVSALAAAVSMSAMAVKVNGDEAVDGGPSYSGSVEFKTTFELDTVDAFQADEDGDSKSVEDSQAGSMSFGLKDDNFKINFEIVQDGDDDDVNFKVSNAIYDDGTWSISPTLGSIISTEGGIEGLGDPISYGVDGAFRYTDKTKAFGVKGLKVQMQVEDAPGDEAAVAFSENADGDVTYKKDAVNGSDFGLAANAAFKAPGSQIEYTFNTQLAEDAGEMANPFVGLKAAGSLNRSLSFMASFNTGASGASLADDADTVNVFGAKVDWTNNDGIAAFGSFGMNGDASAIQVGGSYNLEITEDITWMDFSAHVTAPNDGDDSTDDSIKVYAKARADHTFYYAQSEFTLETEDSNNLKAELGNKSQDAYSFKAMVEVVMPTEGDSDTSFGVEGQYNFDNGAVLGASYVSKLGENALSDDATGNVIGTQQAVLDARAAGIEDGTYADDTAATAALPDDFSGSHVISYAKEEKATELKVWASYELKGGAMLSAAYEMDTDGSRANQDDASALKDGGDVQFTNKLVLTAGYSF